MPFESGQNELLFFKADISSVTDAQVRSATNEVQKIDPDRLLSTPIDDLVAYIVAKYRIDVPVLLRDRAVLDEPAETFIEMNNYGRQIRLNFPLIYQ
jgi:hypothetical protein